MADDARDVLSFKREPRPFALPDVPQVSDPQLRAYLRALKEVVETRLIGGRGGLADRALTYRDALAAGLIEVIDGAGVLRGTGTPVVGTAIPPGVVTDGPLDNITPPAPTGLQAAAALAGVLVQWDAPDPDRVAYTEVFSNGTDNLGTAVLIGTSQGRFYADAVGATGVTKYYWVRFVARGSQELRGPFNAVGGTAATTGRVGNADLTDLIVTAGKLADGAVDLTTNKVVANAQFGALAVGYTVTQYLVATSGVMQNLVVDNAQILSLDAGKINTGFLAADRVQLGSLDAKIAVITNAQIQSLDAGKITTGTLAADRIGALQIAVGKYIRSSNYAAGSAGWNIDGAGAAEFQNVTVRGDVQASSLIANIVDAPNIITSGAVKFTTGSYNSGGPFTATGSNYDLTSQSLVYTADRADSMFLLAGHLHLYWGMQVDRNDTGPVFGQLTYEVRPVLDGVSASSPLWYERTFITIPSGTSTYPFNFRRTVPLVLSWAVSASGARTLALRIIANLVLIGGGGVNMGFVSRAESWTKTIVELKRQRPEETQVTTPRVITPPVVTG